MKKTKTVGLILCFFIVLGSSWAMDQRTERDWISPWEYTETKNNQTLTFKNKQLMKACTSWGIEFQGRFSPGTDWDQFYDHFKSYIERQSAHIKFPYKAKVSRGCVKAQIAPEDKPLRKLILRSVTLVPNFETGRIVFGDVLVSLEGLEGISVNIRNYLTGIWPGADIPVINKSLVNVQSTFCIQQSDENGLTGQAFESMGGKITFEMPAIRNVKGCEAPVRKEVTIYGCGKPFLGNVYSTIVTIPLPVISSAWTVEDDSSDEDSDEGYSLSHSVKTDLSEIIETKPSETESSDNFAVFTTLGTSKEFASPFLYFNPNGRIEYTKGFQIQCRLLKDQNAHIQTLQYLLSTGQFCGVHEGQKGFALSWNHHENKELLRLYGSGRLSVPERFLQIDLAKPHEGGPFADKSDEGYEVYQTLPGKDTDPVWRTGGILSPSLKNDSKNICIHSFDTEELQLNQRSLTCTRPDSVSTWERLKFVREGTGIRPVSGFEYRGMESLKEYTIEGFGVLGTSYQLTQMPKNLESIKISVSDIETNDVYHTRNAYYVFTNYAFPFHGGNPHKGLKNISLTWHAKSGPGSLNSFNSILLGCPHLETLHVSFLVGDNYFAKYSGKCSFEKMEIKSCWADAFYPQDQLKRTYTKEENLKKYEEMSQQRGASSFFKALLKNHSSIKHVVIEALNTSPPKGALVLYGERSNTKDLNGFSVIDPKKTFYIIAPLPVDGDWPHFLDLPKTIDKPGLTVQVLTPNLKK